MLRKYQIEMAQKGAELLKKLKILYLIFEMRVGKTLTAFEICRLLGVRNVLFVTTKLTINSIKSDYLKENYNFEITITNYEQLHKYIPEYELVIVDEAQYTRAYPKPTQRALNLKKIVKNSYMILLSGTPTPESYSEVYHQFWLSEYSPFPEVNFYKWARIYVKMKEVIENGKIKKEFFKKRIRGYDLNDYSKADIDKIKKVIAPYCLTLTQKEAGFTNVEVKEFFHSIEIDQRIGILIKILLSEQYYRFKDGEELVCDTQVKLQCKLHQIYSGTVLTENGIAKYLDMSKIKYIQQHFEGKKIVIFYKYIAEGAALKKEFENWTNVPEEFNDSKDKIFICQIVSGARGVNLSTADAAVFFNIDFSAEIYWQARARIQSFEKKKPAEIHWIFAKNGIEEKIYQTVIKKKTYTSYYFRKDFLNGKQVGKANSGENYQIFEVPRRLCG